MSNKIGQNCIDLAKRSESLHDGDLSKIDCQPKRDPVGIWTVGYGHAIFYQDGTGIKNFEDVKKLYPQYLNITIEQAEQLLSEDMSKLEPSINKILPNLNQNQFDAIADFCFNMGFSRFKGSTLLKRIIAQSPDYMITDAFLMWNKGDINGDGVLEMLPGLTYRRKSEALLYNKGVLQFFN